MNYKNIVYVICLAACQHSYTPDMSLKKHWTSTIEETQPSDVPYAVTYEIGSKKVIYAAANHKAESQALIKKIIEQEKPEIVLLQRYHQQEVIPPQYPQLKHKPVFKGSSSPRDQLIKHLDEYGITERDFVIGRTLLFMNQKWQFDVHSYKDLEDKAIHYLKTDTEARKFNLSLKDIQMWFYEKMGVSMTEGAIRDSFNFAPKDPLLPTTNYLQKMNSYANEVDDAVNLQVLGEMLKTHSVVMIVRAGSKYVMERDILHDMFGAPSTLMK